MSPGAEYPRSSSSSDRETGLVSLRTAQLEVTRTRIREAAARLFVEHHFDRTTMDHIAVAAKLRRSTVYLHYKDKTAVLADIVADYLPRAGEVMAQLPGPVPSRQQIQRWIKNVIRFWTKEQVVTTVLQEVGRNMPGLPSLHELRGELFRGLSRNVPAFEKLGDPGKGYSRKRARAELLILSLTHTCNYALFGADKAHISALCEVTADDFAKFIAEHSAT